MVTSDACVLFAGTSFNSNVGTDLHKTSLTFAVRDNCGTLIKTVQIDCKCVNKIKDFITFLPRPIHLKPNAFRNAFLIYAIFFSSFSFCREPDIFILR